MKLPRVAVLLPTYNGEDYLGEQLKSIMSQVGVSVTLFYHDDGSTDQSVNILENWGESVFEVDGPIVGGAAQNVFFLLTSVNWSEFDFVALADQDDLWAPNKLSRALTILEESGCSVYSSNVTAFWEDGSEQEIVKSQPQREFDFLFEAGGPGNTHVYTVDSANAIGAFIEGLDSALRDKVKLHDWLIYAFCRHSGIDWIIDDFSSLLYRQHGQNVMGASSGWASWLRRGRLLFGDWYFEQVQQIILAIDFKNGSQFFFTDSSPLHSFFWMFRPFQLRRRKGEAIVLLFALVIRCIKILIWPTINKAWPRK